MKTQRLISLGILMAIMAFTSCSKDEVNPPSKEPADFIPTAAEFNQLTNQTIDNLRQDTFFNAENGISFLSDKGVNVIINPNTLTLNGNPVTGKVDLQYIEIFDAATMVVANKPTMGITDNGDTALLVSGGEFYIMATQNSDTLELSAPMELFVPVNLTGGADYSMIMWDGIIDQNGNLTWSKSATQNMSIFQDMGPANPNDPMGGGIPIGPKMYDISLDTDFGWFNCDRFYGDQRPKTKIQVKLPEAYNNDNCSVYLYLDEVKNALGHFSFSNNNQIFYYKKLPIGLEAHIIIKTAKEQQFLYAIKGITVAENGSYTYTLEEAATGSEDDIVAAVMALP